MITSDSALAELCRLLKGCSSIGLDLEFQRERTYFPRLCLVQIACPEIEGKGLALVDPFGVRRLGPLFELLADPRIETIVHSGSQDLEIIHNSSGLVPRNVFDTQIGGALIGYGDQPGYATLVEKILGVRLAKLETVTDWSRRPLTEGQVAYAFDDVRYLHSLRQHIGRELEKLGRTEWAREEMAHYEDESTYVKDSSGLFLKIARARILNRRGLAILRELAVWREEEAMRRDEPRGRILSDDVLVEIARRAPTRPSNLEVLRGIHPGELRRSGSEIVAAVGRATKLPESQWPEIPAGRNDDPETSLSVDLLEVFLKARARQARIGASYLGSRQDLADLLESIRADTPASDGVLLLQGWRKRLIGEDLVALALGRLSLHIDPESGCVTTTNR
jgi:ribonuclease D